jgi:hypothetical protein
MILSFLEDEDLVLGGGVLAAGADMARAGRLLEAVLAGREDGMSVFIDTVFQYILSETVDSVDFDVEQKAIRECRLSGKNRRKI